MAPAVKLVTPVDGFTVTKRSAVVLVQEPVAVAVIVASPLKVEAQFITPVLASIAPAPTGATE
ncbi:hypothetical protein D3C84_1178340 [compost metagenome]